MEARTELIESPTLSVPHPSKRGFFAYVHERYMISERRHIEKRPAPWTTDQTLQQFHFCSHKRKWDWGTQWFLQKVVPQCSSPMDVVWRAALYRMINVPEFFQAMSALAGCETIVGLKEYDDPALRERLEREIMAYGGIHCTAYLILGGTSRSHTRNEALVMHLKTLRNMIAPLAADVLSAPSLHTASQILDNAPGLGTFLAYQTARDLILAGVAAWDENEWTEVGPGGKRGLYLIFGDVPAKKELEYVKKLQASLPESYAALGVTPAPEELSLSACDIQHNLCEYQKLVRYKSGKGKRRYFSPHKAELPNGYVVR